MELAINYLPVCIMNEGEKEVIISDNNSSIPILIEALNKNNNWEMIGHRYQYCGVNVFGLRLNKNEMICTSIPKYEGDFKTKIRVKLKNIVSNEIEASIYEEQFEKNKN